MKEFLYVLHGISILILWIAIMGMMAYHTVNYNEDIID